MNLFDIVNKKVQLSNLEKKTLEPDFWNDNKESGKVLSEIKTLKDTVSNYTKAESELINIIEMTELVMLEFDEELAKEILINTKKISKEIEDLELKTFLSGKYDKNSAILTIHPGAGGTESQDWAEMLYRMYTRWANKNNYQLNEVDFLEGDEAGIKSVTFEVIGENAYGYLKGEMGVHRLVRISPFDSNSRRHTSFASVEVLPEITDDIELDINPDDLRIEDRKSVV